MGRTGGLWLEERGKRVWVPMWTSMGLDQQARPRHRRWTPNISGPA